MHLEDSYQVGIFCILGIMRLLVQLLLLISFALTVILAVTGAHEVWIALLFVLMISLIGALFAIMYWIPPRTVESMLAKGEQVRFTAFGSRLLSMADAGLPRPRAPYERGRLVVTDQALRFFVKKREGKHTVSLETLVIPISQIEAAGLGQVLSSSKGLIVTAKKHKEAHFSIIGMEKKFPDFKRALGWAA